MNDLNIKTIRFPVITNEKLEKLSQKFGRSKLELFNQMVMYFYRSRKDPADHGDEQLKKTLDRNHDTYTGFIKAQEKVLLIPMKTEMERMIRNQEQIVKFFNEQIIKANKELLEGQRTQLNRFTEVDKIIRQVYQDRDTSRKLKQKFLLLLDGYVSKRESLGAFKNKEKEELLEQVRKQIEDL